MVKSTLSVIVSAAVFMLVACSGEDDAGKSGQSAASTAKPTVAAAGVGVTVKADKTHAVQPNDAITLTISVTDFRLDADNIGAANQDNVGHFRVYLDAASGDDYLAVGADTTAKVIIPADISDGSHDLRVVLHNNDKSPLQPAVEASALLIVYRL